MRWTPCKQAASNNLNRCTVETAQERAYRSAFRKVEALQIELARHVYSVQRRVEAERKLQEAMQMLDHARRELIQSRRRQVA